MALKVKFKTQFPANVTVSSPLTLLKTGLSYVFGLSIDDLRLSLDQFYVGPTSVRERLLAARTYYVRADGNDSNSGLSNTSGGAFLTPQKAADTIIKTLDTNGYTITIELTGAFTTPMQFRGPIVGGGLVAIQATGTASITTTSADAISASRGANIRVNTAGLTLSTVTGGSGLIAYAGGRIEYGGLTFGPCAGSQIQAGALLSSGAAALDQLTGPGTVEQIGNYAIAAGTSISHLHVVGAGSQIQLKSGSTITLTGTPVFSAYFAGVSKGLLYADGVIWTGAATGIRYVIHRGGTLVVSSSRTELPGNAAGTVDSGGVYAASNDAISDLGLSGSGTPVLAFGGASVGITASTQTYNTVRLGSLVYETIVIILTSKGSSVGSATVSMSATPNVAGACAIQGNNLAAAATTQLQAQFAAGIAAINLQRFAAGAATAMADTDFNNNSVIRITCVYTV